MSLYSNIAENSIYINYSMYEPSFTSFEKGPSVENPQANIQLQTLFIFDQYRVETNIVSTSKYNHYLTLYASIGLKYHFQKGTVPSYKVQSIELETQRTYVRSVQHHRSFPTLT